MGSFAIEQYATYLHAHWRFIAISCVSATLLALLATVLIPKSYTATARIVVEAAAAGEIQAPQAISPQYVEMLKTYEQYASSDLLFHEALDHFSLREEAPNRAIEDWKRQVLEVGMVGATKVLEISATLHDPQTAQAMAQFLAERTVALSQQVSRDADADLTLSANHLLDQSRTEFELAEQRWNELAQQQPVEDLATRIEGLELRQASLEQALVDLKAGTTETVPANPGPRITQLETEREGVEQALASATRTLARRLEARQQATETLGRARARYEESQQQFDQIRARTGFRGERLQLIDPGIVPEKASFPNLPLNLIAAALLSLFAAIGVLTVKFGLRSSPTAT